MAVRRPASKSLAICPPSAAYERMRISSMSPVNGLLGVTDVLQVPPRTMPASAGTAPVGFVPRRTPSTNSARGAAVAATKCHAPSLIGA